MRASERFCAKYSSAARKKIHEKKRDRFTSLRTVTFVMKSASKVQKPSGMCEVYSDEVIHLYLLLLSSSSSSSWFLLHLLQVRAPMESHKRKIGFSSLFMYVVLWFALLQTTTVAAGCRFKLLTERKFFVIIVPELHFVLSLRCRKLVLVGKEWRYMQFYGNL